MASISKMNEKLEQLEKKIEEQKQVSNEYLGEAIIDVLDIDYELLSTKKDSKEVAETIKNALKSNPFSNKSIEEKDNNSEQELNDEKVAGNNEQSFN